ncbi:winged helix-turn-helix domain-containing protein [Stackebrandtia soli]|uniref:winged helix-turn-helix domain-containing protein n=1 Tax=Stackebrandtia soli TaxID=1892856 RepID=UPI0039EB0083
MSATEEDNDWPVRQITDLDSLRALAHPLRMRLLELLAAHGPATATELAGRVDESPANCSWHLRKLADGGFITETGEGTGRRREWKFVPRGSSFGNTDDPELNAAGDAAGTMLIERELAEYREWTTQRSRFGPEWSDAAFSTQSMQWLTLEELETLNADITRLLLRNINRFTDPSLRPPDAKLIRLMAWGAPSIDLNDTPDNDKTTEDTP